MYTQCSTLNTFLTKYTHKHFIFLHAFMHAHTHTHTYTNEHLCIYVCMHTHAYVAHLPSSACEGEHGHVEMSESAREREGRGRSKEGREGQKWGKRRLNNISAPNLPAASAKGRRYVL